MGNVEKMETESIKDYTIRLFRNKEEYNLDCNDIATLVNKISGDNKGSSAYRKWWKPYSEGYEDGYNDSIKDSDNVDSESYLQSLEKAKEELQKERYKLQTSKLIPNKKLREEARSELITEEILNAIKELSHIVIPKDITPEHGDKSGILIFGDEHVGTEFKIMGLHGEIINEYNFEIFVKRMINLLAETIEIIHKEGFKHIDIFSMGDFCDGILRVSQLKKLQSSLMKTTVAYAFFMIEWLNTLSKEVDITMHMVHGNHSELRMLDQPKGTFKDENLGILVQSILEFGLKDNPNFKIKMNPTGLIFDNIQGFNILGVHGEVKDMERAIKDFSSVYDTKIHILVGGHLHHSMSESVGMETDVMRVPSIIGVDDFSMSLNKVSNAGATFIIVEKGKGKVQEYNIKLN